MAEHLHVNHSVRASSVLVLTVALLLAGGCAGKPATTTEQKLSFWPTAPDQPRVQFLTGFARSSDVTEKRSAFDTAIYGKEAELPIVNPYSVAMHKGRIYVCDTENRGVVVLDLKARLVKVMGRAGGAELLQAVDIAIAPDGTKYVADKPKGRIVVFDANDRYVQAFSPPELDPISVAVSGDELFVSDFSARQVKVLNRSSGELIRTIGTQGREDGQFFRPLSVRVDKDGHVLVSDVFKCRIQRFTREGEFIDAVGRIGNRPGDFARPKHMAIDSNGLTYVVDASFNNVQIFDEKLKVLMFFGAPGPHPGGMRLPAGICISEDPEDIELFRRYIHPAFDAQRLVLVTNQSTQSKVAVYAQGELKPGRTLADLGTNAVTKEAGIAPPGARDNLRGPDSPDAEPTAEPATPAGPATQPGR